MKNTKVQNHDNGFLVGGNKQFVITIGLWIDGGERHWVISPLNCGPLVSTILQNTLKIFWEVAKKLDF